MKKCVPTILLLITCFAGATTAFADLSAEKRLADARTVIDLYEYRYAPAPWKKEFKGIDMDALAERLLAAAGSDLSDEEFYEALARYTADLKDAHVNLIIPSSYRAALGFETDYIEGHVIITGINRSILDQDAFPFKKGDRLISLNGFSADEIIRELSEIHSTGVDQVDRRINARNIPWREQALFPDMPEGSAAVAVQPRASSEIRTVQLEWIVSGMPLAPYETPLSSSKSVRLGGGAPRGPLDKLRDLSAFAGSHRAEGIEWHSKQPLFPLWEDFEEVRGAPVLAGTATAGGRRIAYMKIPTFMDSLERRNAMIDFLSDEIPTFQSSTDAMIIDLTGNGGGYICYAEAIASFLIDEPIDSIRVQIKPKRTWAVEFEEALEWTSDENDRAILLDTIEKIRDGLAKGTPLTEPAPICFGGGTIKPARETGLASATYTKPILILVDEFSASAAEMFPALLQDAGRATVFGSRTMGAGGSVGEIGPIGTSDVTVTITESLVRRSKEITAPGGTMTHYIENVGVIPDVPYEITLDDYLNGYDGYLRALERAALEMTDE